MWDATTNAAVEAVLAQPSGTIGDVISKQVGLNGALAGLNDLNGDNPVVAFNELYIQVTEAVRDRLDPAHPEHFQDAAFMEVLDVEFARLYFEAMADWIHPIVDPLSDAWIRLFELEHAGERHSNLEGALLGVNAHINHDLTLALLEAVKIMPPGDMVARREDFDSINVIFETLMPPITKRLINEMRNKWKRLIFRIMDWLLGDLDEDITLKLIVEMRDQAWERAENIWAGTGGAGGGFWDDFANFLADVLVQSGLFITDSEQLRGALTRSGLRLLTTDLLLFEPQDDGRGLLVSSANRRVPGQWSGRRGELASLLTDDWLFEAIEEEQRMTDSADLDLLLEDLTIIREGHRRADSADKPPTDWNRSRRVRLVSR